MILVQRLVKPTVRSSSLTCSCLRIALSSSNLSCCLCESSSACCFSFACWRLSISALRFAAEDEELCESVPSRAPNSLWPRLRSSTCPLLRRASRCSSSTLAGRGGSLLPSLLSRGRLESFSDMEDCLRLREVPSPGDEGSGVGSWASGTTMADAIILNT
jgi:hypothetical protein